MPIEMKPVETIKDRLGFDADGKIQLFVTNNCARRMDKYVPFDTGTLAETVMLDGKPTENVGKDKITYSTPYAKIVYHGVRGDKELNYHTDKHELAGPYWDQRMISAEIDDIIEETEKYMKRGGKK